ncbi:uncharacterized protein LOC121730881 [Aricia agestis]|uniref:uncharacterized protein LOC121730881 n=1 Tax=Aricia agestis TaxID=91739 RepID=UPI001C203F28|nr:uncharacterized protein LOC121730881 [Aricia agestis]
MHHLPLPALAAARTTPEAVVHASYVRTDRPRRYGSVRRTRRDLPRMFGAAPVPSTYPPRLLPLESRQPAGGARPRYVPPPAAHSLTRNSREEAGEGRDLYDVLYEAYCGSRLLASRLASRVSTRSQASRQDPDSVPYGLNEAQIKTPLEIPDASKHLSASQHPDVFKHLDVSKHPDASIQMSQHPDVSVQYEALADTVQYELLDTSQCYSVPYGMYTRYAARRGDRSARAQRAAVRCVLAASGALYALAFIAFYFLSL